MSYAFVMILFGIKKENERESSYIYFVFMKIRFMYGKPDVPKASPEIAAEAYSELAPLQETGDWNAAVELVIKAGDPKAQSIAANDWYRLRRSLEIIKVRFTSLAI